jgi:ubiquinone/menaquinone biosynthesis C-methylase UbiE
MIQEQVMKDPRERFTEGVDAYRRYRPDYPAALVEWVLDQASLRPGDLVVDVGCGTGITSRLFARRGLCVIGVDPNTAMLAAARSPNGEVRYVKGAVEDLPLRDAIGKAAIAGQAFHWFDLDHALAELARVLVPGAACFAFWNIREHSTPFLREYEQLLKDWCPVYPVASADETVARLLAHPSVSEPRENALSQIQSLDKDGLMGRAWSSSYVVHGVDDVAGFNAALAQLFDTYNEDGAIEFRYRTVALAFVPRTQGA